MTRVGVFIDYQNAYMRARDAFGLREARSVEGQIDPLKVGMLLTERGRTIDRLRMLASVHVFRGEPSSKHSPVGQSACQRQVAAWTANPLVEAHTRPLRYLPTGSVDGVEHFVAREKGIDVLLALETVLGAERDEFDVCVLFSADTDLLPALEHVRSTGRVIETAAWRPDSGYARSLTLPGMWCHRLGRRDFELVTDHFDYASR